MALSASLHVSGLLGFTVREGALKRLATPKVGGPPTGPTPPGTGGTGGGDSDAGAGGAGGTYSAAAQNGTATMNGLTGGGGGGDGATVATAGFFGASTAGGSANGAANHGGAGGAGGLTFESATYVLSGEGGYNGADGGAGGGTNAGGGGGGLGGFGVLTDHTSAVTLSGATVQGGGGGGGGAGDTSGNGGGGGDGGFGIGFNAGGASSLMIAASGVLKGGQGGTGGAGGSSGAGGQGGAGGIGLYENDSAFTLTNAGTITGGDAGTAGVSNGGSSTGSNARLLGGVGVTGANLTVTDTGTISGGFNLGGAEADAIDFTSGAGLLTLSTLNGTGVTHGAINVVAGALQIDPGAAASVTLGSDIMGDGTVEKIGANTLILTGVDNDNPGTTVTAGVLQIGAGGTTGSVGDNLRNGGVIIDNAVVAFDRSDNTSFYGTISGTGSVHIMGAGNYGLASANTYVGGTVISAGKLGVNNSTVTGGAETSSSVGTGTVTFDGGYLAPQGNQTFANAAKVDVNGGGFYLNGTTLTWNGVISDSSAMSVHALAVQGSGALVLGSANTFTGGMTVTDATVQFDNGNELGTGAISLSTDSYLKVATLDSTSASATTITNAVSVSDSNTYIGGAINGANVILSGALTGSGGASLNIGDNNNADQVSLLTLSHADAGFSGTMDVWDGSSLVAGGSNVFGAQAFLQTDSGSIVNLNGYSQTVAYLDGDGYSTGMVENLGASAATLTVGANAYRTEYDGVIENGGAALAIVKQGSATFVEGGASTYSGGTTLSAGTLELNHATTGSFGHITSGAAGDGAITFSGAATLLVDTVTNVRSHTADALDPTTGELYYAINGFAAGDTIDMIGVSGIDTAVYSAAGGALTLMNSGHTTDVLLHIGTGYTGYTFTVASDGNGGANVTVSAPPPPPPSSGGGGPPAPPVGPSGTQTGGAGNDTLTAGAGASTVFGGGGDDHINGGTGSATLYGNAGNDTITLFSYTANSTVFGGQGDDHIDASQSTQPNFLSGDLGNDYINTGSGNDTAYGGGGADTLVGGSGHDQLYGNMGSDYIYLQSTNAGSTVYGGQGDDVIDGSATTTGQFLSGDAGNDIILGGAGGDTIYGGSGSDTIEAAAGATTFIHTGLADSSAVSATDASQLDHVTGFGAGTKLVFDGDPAGTAANTVFHHADASIANYAAAYAYAYGSGGHAGAITGAVEYVVVDDTAGHTYVFAANHAAIELDGLAGGANAVSVGQLVAS